MSKQRLYQGPIFVQRSLVHGYGVFAAVDIQKGEIIEECHTLTAEEESKSFPNHYFKAEDKSGLPLGFGCIYNHSPTPNIEYTYHPQTGLTVFTALKAIRCGEELCSSYGHSWFDSRKIKMRTTSQGIWFAGRPLLRAALIVTGLWGILQGISYCHINNIIL